MAAREMGGLSLADALSLFELLANAGPARYERAAWRWLQRFINERLSPSPRSRSRLRRVRNFGTARDTLASRRSRASFVTARRVSLGGLRDFMSHRQQVKHGDRDDKEEHHSEYRAALNQYESSDGVHRDGEQA
jgi:hypothetical protein